MLRIFRGATSSLRSGHKRQCAKWIFLLIEKTLIILIQFPTPRYINRKSVAVTVRSIRNNSFLRIIEMIFFNQCFISNTLRIVARDEAYRHVLALKWSGGIDNHVHDGAHPALKIPEKPAHLKYFENLTH